LFGKGFRSVASADFASLVDLASVLYGGFVVVRVKVRMMGLTFEAIYENGVLRPLESLALPNLQHVLVTISGAPANRRTRPRSTPVPIDKPHMVPHAQAPAIAQPRAAWRWSSR